MVSLQSIVSFCFFITLHGQKCLPWVIIEQKWASWWLLWFFCHVFLHASNYLIKGILVFQARIKFVEKICTRPVLFPFCLLRKRHCVCHICHPNTLCWSDIAVVHSSPETNTIKRMRNMFNYLEKDQKNVYVILKMIGMMCRLAWKKQINI